MRDELFLLGLVALALFGVLVLQGPDAALFVAGGIVVLSIVAVVVLIVLGTVLVLGTEDGP